MPTVNLKQPILNFDGTACKEQIGQDVDGNPLSSTDDLLMSTMCINVLSVLDQDEQQKAAKDGLTGGKLKLERFLLKQRIYNAPDRGVHLSAEEITLLKELLGRYATDLVVGRIYAVLDPPPGEDASIPDERLSRVLVGQNKQKG